MGFFSVVAVSPAPFSVSNPFAQLDTGRNAFTVQTDDIDAFLARLRGRGAEIIALNQLDKHEAFDPNADDLRLTNNPQTGILHAQEDDDGEGA